MPYEAGHHTGHKLCMPNVPCPPMQPYPSCAMRHALSCMPSQARRHSSAAPCLVPLLPKQIISMSCHFIIVRAMVPVPCRNPNFELAVFVYVFFHDFPNHRFVHSLNFRLLAIFSLQPCSAVQNNWALIRTMWFHPHMLNFVFCSRFTGTR